MSLALFGKSLSELEYYCAVESVGKLWFEKRELLHVVNPLHVVLQSHHEGGHSIEFPAAYVSIVDDPLQVVATYFQNPFLSLFRKTARDFGYRWLERRRLLFLIKEKAERSFTEEEIFAATREYREEWYKALVEEPEDLSNVFHLKDYIRARR